MTESDYIKILESRLSKHRFEHSLAVASSSLMLAKLYGEDEKKAYKAGLLHDILKDSSKDEMLLLFEQYKHKLSPEEKASPKLWHAIGGDIYCRHILKIDDEDVLAAIRYHTTGRQGMNLLEKIVFVADFIAEDREYKDVQRMRKKAKISLELAMLEGFQFTMTKLLEYAKPIHSDMLSAYNEIIRSGEFMSQYQDIIKNQKQI